MEIKTLSDIQEAIIRRAKLADNDEVRADLLEKINTAYRKICFQKFYRWSGTTMQMVLKAKYTTGTISATDGSHTITGVSTAWSELSHWGWKIKLGSSSVPHKIVRVTSSTSIEVEPAYIGSALSGASYTMFKDEYGMFPDLHEVRKIYIPGQRIQPTPEGPEFVDERRYSSPFRSGNPQWYTLNGKNVYTAKTWATFSINFDFFEDPVTIDQPRNENLILHPCIFTTDKVAQIRYTFIPRALSAATDEPLMPLANRPILVYKTLVEDFMQKRDLLTAKEWEKEFKSYEKDMEGDVESVDDDLVFQIDRRSHRRVNYGLLDDDCSSGD